MWKYDLTIFTPTYNRAYIIEQLYNSLCRQSRFNFEWLVVDDGSDDNTYNLISSLKEQEKQFDINYYKKENGGKHRAINYGLDVAQGKLFFVVDSDDYLTDDAVEKIYQWYSEIEDSQLVGIVANKSTDAKQQVNPCFEEEYLDKSFFDIDEYMEKGKFVLTGERAIIFLTDFHRNYKYPEIENEKFMTEAVVYNQMARDGYKLRFFNDIIWIYEYLDDGLTKAGISNFINNPKGYALWLKGKKAYVKGSFLEKTKILYVFMCDLINDYSIDDIAKYFDVPYYKIKFLSIMKMIKQKIKKRR